MSKPDEVEFLQPRSREVNVAETQISSASLPELVKDSKPAIETLASINDSSRTLVKYPMPSTTVLSPTSQQVFWPIFRKM